MYIFGKNIRKLLCQEYLSIPIIVQKVNGNNYFNTLLIWEEKSFRIIPAVKCYQKVGFRFTQNKSLLTWLQNYQKSK